MKYRRTVQVGDVHSFHRAKAPQFLELTAWHCRTDATSIISHFLWLPSPNDWITSSKCGTDWGLWQETRCTYIPGSRIMRHVGHSATTPLAGMRSSQNHRMVGVGRDLCGSSSPTLLPKQEAPAIALQVLAATQAKGKCCKRAYCNTPLLGRIAAASLTGSVDSARCKF